jgi:hypothetical protein
MTLYITLDCSMMRDIPNSNPFSYCNQLYKTTHSQYYSDPFRYRLSDYMKKPYEKLSSSIKPYSLPTYEHSIASDWKTTDTENLQQAFLEKSISAFLKYTLKPSLPSPKPKNTQETARLKKELKTLNKIFKKPNPAKEAIEKVAQQTFFDIDNTLSKIVDHRPLDVDKINDVKLKVKTYYETLAKNGEPYGELALDILEKRTAFGKISHLYLKSAAKELGYTQFDIEKIAWQYPIYCAYQDMGIHLNYRTMTYEEQKSHFLTDISLIISPEDLGMIKYPRNDRALNNVEQYKAIATYNYYVLKKLYNFPKEAWIGSLFEEFGGSGSWMRLAGYKIGTEVNLNSIITAVENDESHDGVSARTAMKYLWNARLIEADSTEQSAFNSPAFSEFWHIASDKLKHFFTSESACTNEKLNRNKQLKAIRQISEESYSEIEGIVQKMLEHKSTTKELKIAIIKANRYYERLAETGEVYGQVALDVTEKRTPFGKTAHLHLEAIGKAYGRGKSVINSITEKYLVYLAYRNMKMRSDKLFNPDTQYEMIANYHYDGLAKLFGFPREAWGGALFEEFSGSGSWMRLAGYNEGAEIDIGNIISAIKNDDAHGSIGARKALKLLIHTQVYAGIQKPNDFTVEVPYYGPPPPNLMYDKAVLSYTFSNPAFDTLLQATLDKTKQLFGLKEDCKHHESSPGILVDELIFNPDF